MQRWYVANLSFNYVVLNPSLAFFINICLTILGWIPGALHALYVTSILILY